MADTFTTIWNRLLMRAPIIGPALAQDFVRDAFNQLMERREWSWLIKHSSFYPAIFYQTGTVAILPNTNYVTGTGTAWTASMVGCQFRPGSPPSNYPTYTIVQVLSATQIVLDTPWVGPTLSGSGYQIFQCYFTVPDDFNYFYSIVNPTANYRLYHNVTQATIDMCDPQRVQTGITYAASFYDYSNNYSGTVGSIIQVSGSGPAPISTTSYGFSFPENSIYSLQITVGGAPGSGLTFKWKQDNGIYATVAVADNNPIDLSNGVQVYFPTATYIVADVFVSQCSAGAIAGLPRYELWPRPVNQPYVYPFLYVSKLPALTTDNPALPDFIARRGDVLLEMSESAAARFPGTDAMRNPFYDLNLADRFQVRSERMIMDLELKDDDTAIKDLKYDNYPFYPAPWLDGSWLQKHAMGV